MATPGRCVHPDDTSHSCHCLRADHPTLGRVEGECSDHLNQGDAPWCYIDLQCPSGFESTGVPNRAWKWCETQVAAGRAHSVEVASSVACHCAQASHPVVGTLKAECRDQLETGEAPWCYVSLQCPSGLASQTVPDRAWKWCVAESHNTQALATAVDSASRCGVAALCLSLAFIFDSIV